MPGLWPALQWPAKQSPAKHRSAKHRSTGPTGDERPERPFTGYKLAHAVLSADGKRAGFAGMTLGAASVYGAVADASCVWNSHHAPPRRWCGCGFYCLHDLADARDLSCATENRGALLLQVTASGRYIRYERGLRYSRQRVAAVLGARCCCGSPGTALTDAGSGLVGWRHLTPSCARCADGRPSLTLRDFSYRLEARVRLAAPLTAPGETVPRQRDPDAPPPTAGESPFAVLTAEVALLQARLDHLESRLDR
jgi:hypothetical protein